MSASPSQTFSLRERLTDVGNPNRGQASGTPDTSTWKLWPVRAMDAEVGALHEELSAQPHSLPPMPSMCWTQEEGPVTAGEALGSRQEGRERERWEPHGPQRPAHRKGLFALET